jgi:hypothetical protein
MDSVMPGGTGTPTNSHSGGEPRLRRVRDPSRNTPPRSPATPGARPVNLQLGVLAANGPRLDNPNIPRSRRSPAQCTRHHCRERGHPTRGRDAESTLTHPRRSNTSTCPNGDGAATAGGGASAGRRDRRNAHSKDGGPTMISAGILVDTSTVGRGTDSGGPAFDTEGRSVRRPSHDSIHAISHRPALTPQPPRTAAYQIRRRPRTPHRPGQRPQSVASPRS